MKKPKNLNISLINKHFNNKMKMLLNNIKLLDVTISEYKTSLTKWYNSLYGTDKHSSDSMNIKQVINQFSRELRYYKEQRKMYVKQYTEIKQMQKVMSRAIEERWMNGFADGVKFVNEVLDEKLKVLV